MQNFRKKLRNRFQVELVTDVWMDGLTDGWRDNYKSIGPPKSVVQKCCLVSNNLKLSLNKSEAHNTTLDKESIYNVLQKCYKDTNYSKQQNKLNRGNGIIRIT